MSNQDTHKEAQVRRRQITMHDFIYVFMCAYIACYVSVLRVPMDDR